MPEQAMQVITVNDTRKTTYAMNITGLKQGYNYTFVVSI